MLGAVAASTAGVRGKSPRPRPASAPRRRNSRRGNGDASSMSHPCRPARDRRKPGGRRAAAGDRPGGFMHRIPGRVRSRRTRRTPFAGGHRSSCDGC
jgi:hypothetical protein